MNHGENGNLALDYILGKNLALALLLLTALSLILLLALIRSRYLLHLAVALTALQGIHTYEHLLQAYKWLLQPYQPGFISYPAQLIATGFAGLADQLGYTGTGLGMELLHLVGNIIFLIGSLAIYLVRKNNAATALLYFESVHVIEHLTLTITASTGRPAWGASTFFARLSGAELTSFRVSWHLLMNLIAFILAILALRNNKKTINIKTLTLTTLTLSALPLVAALTTPPDPGYIELSQLLLTPIGITSLLLTPTTVTLIIQIIQYSKQTKSTTNQIKEL